MCPSLGERLELVKDELEGTLNVGVAKGYGGSADGRWTGYS
jgi:hypothetical protein